MSTKITGFTEAKRRVVDAIDFRLDGLKRDRDLLAVNGRGDHFGYENRIDELETIRAFVKGMVVKVDDSDQN